MTTFLLMDKDAHFLLAEPVMSPHIAGISPDDPGVPNLQRGTSFRQAFFFLSLFPVGTQLASII